MSSTQGPAALIRHFARKVELSPVSVFFVKIRQQRSWRSAQTTSVRGKMRAPLRFASRAFRITNLESSTQQSEYSNALRKLSLSGLPILSFLRSITFVGGNIFLAPM